MNGCFFYILKGEAEKEFENDLRRSFTLFYRTAKEQV